MDKPKISVIGHASIDYVIDINNFGDIQAKKNCETYYNYCKKKKTGIVNPFYLFKDGDGV